MSDTWPVLLDANHADPELEPTCRDIVPLPPAAATTTPTINDADAHPASTARPRVLTKSNAATSLPQMMWRIALLPGSAM
jgi:hypothetical protein